MTGLLVAARGAHPMVRDATQLADVLGTAFSIEQLAAITAPLEPGAVIAGAGSGKTTVMAARVVWLVGQRLVEPDQVLGLTFTNKSAAELGARIRSALHQLHSAAGLSDRAVEHGEPTVSTYHAYAGALVAEHGLRLGFEPDQRLVADASGYQRAARVVQRCAATLPTVSTDLATVVRDVVHLDAQLSDHLVEVDDVLRFDTDLRDELATVRQLRPVHEAVAASVKRDELLMLVALYRRAKQDDDVVDFSDQMARGAHLAMLASEVSRCERDRYRVVLLDEYQDTSVAQRLMLQGLFSGETPATGRGHAVTAVGDPCQAIYGWRGASVDNLDAFPRHFPRQTGRDAASYALVVNRRCDHQILGAANAVAAPLFDKHPSVRPLAPRPEAGPGEIRTGCLETVVDEITWMVEQIVAVHDQSDTDWSDIAILVRDGSEIGAVAAALRQVHVPVEVVGLSGLLGSPEVADVLATLEVVHSLTANAALLRLLTGPRWRIGVRDLALLGERAGQLAAGGAPPPVGDGLPDKLERAVMGADPTEVRSLSDALDDPGRLPYSDAARGRFATLAGELRRLRSHVGDPLSDLTRRVVETTGLDVELGADPNPAGAQARDNVALLLDAVADFAAADPAASLNGLLAYLHAEEDFNRGMSVATPSANDSVKLLTVHKAKGLEWPVVLLPFMAAKVFPNERSRERWSSTPAELPSPLRGDASSLPQVGKWTTAGVAAFKREVRGEALLEERRLGYVALTRAKRLLIASAHWWGRTQQQPRGPSEYLRQLREHAPVADAVMTSREALWVEGPDDGAPNPLLTATANVAWPAPLDSARLERRRRAARAVRDALAGHPAPAPCPRTTADAAALQRLEALDDELDALVAEATTAAPDVVEVPLPATLSATTLIRMHSDPDALAADLVRPMPRRPSRGARFGTRFHAWVELYVGQQALLEPHDLPGAADAGIVDDADLMALTAAFQEGPFGDRTPCAVEAPFSLTLAGQVVVGRIDAVYEDRDGFVVVDWKTSREPIADPTQLALYRLAWAELNHLPLGAVRAAFYYVRTGQVVVPAELPGREELEHRLGGGSQPGRSWAGP